MADAGNNAGCKVSGMHSILSSGMHSILTYGMHSIHIYGMQDAR